MSTWGDYSFMEMDPNDLRNAMERIRDQDREAREQRTKAFLQSLGYTFTLPEPPAKREPPKLRVI